MHYREMTYDVDANRFEITSSPEDEAASLRYFDVPYSLMSNVITYGIERESFDPDEAVTLTDEQALEYLKLRLEKTWREKIDALEQKIYELNFAEFEPYSNHWKKYSLNF